MIKNRIKKTFTMVLFLVGLCTFPHIVQAEGILDSSGGSIYIRDDAVLENGKTTIRWSGFSDRFSYDIELADNKKFKNAKQYSTNATELTIQKSAFGKHGGRFYIRIRAVENATEESDTTTIGAWSTPVEMVFVKIDKTNFPGMYKVMKNGSTRINIITGAVEKIIYDKNGDGWLDPVEADAVYTIVTTDISKKVNGKYKLTKATSISSFEGVEYFPNLYSIQVMRYSGKKADLSKCSAVHVEFRRHASKQLTVIAPNAKTVRVIEPLKDNTQIDLKKCSSAVSIEVNADNTKGTKVLKLPKKKTKLKLLDLCKVQVKSLNLNAYTKLQQLYMYRCDTKSVKVNKCKNLRYVYICQCRKIKSLNLKSNKKLRGADFYETPGLTRQTVKQSKSGKYTWNKGPWWEDTSAYKKDMNNLY